MKSFAVEGTVFWLVFSALLLAITSVGHALRGNAQIAAPGVVTAVVYVLVAYVCWDLRRWGLVAAIILALFTALGTLVQGVFVGELTLFRTLADYAFLTVPQYLLIFYAFRAYRELATG